MRRTHDILQRQDTWAKGNYAARWAELFMQMWSGRVWNGNMPPGFFCTSRMCAYQILHSDQTRWQEIFHKVDHGQNLCDTIPRMPPRDLFKITYLTASQVHITAAIIHYHAATHYYHLTWTYFTLYYCARRLRQERKWRWWIQMTTVKQQTQWSIDPLLWWDTAQKPEMLLWSANGPLDIVALRLKLKYTEMGRFTLVAGQICCLCTILLERFKTSGAIHVLASVV